MKNKINLNIILLIFILLTTSCSFLAIPEGKLEPRHNPTGSHNTETTKLKADSSKPFEEYIAHVKAMVEIIAKNHDNSIDRVEAATPFQWFPREKENGPTCDTNNTKNAALLIHGLTDTPFLMRDIGEYLNSEHCFLVRSILLPGHGTVPGDLLDEKNANHIDWIDASGYGINSFFNDKENLEIENFYIVGFSTGGALALYHALYSTEKKEFKKASSKLRGLILLSPAIQIKEELKAKLSNWHKYTYSLFIPEGKWIDLAEDKDYAKYESFPKNAADHVHKLSNKVYCQENSKLWEFPEFKGWPILGRAFCSENIDRLKIPVLMAMSKEDMTVDTDTDKAIKFFKKHNDKNSTFILYHADNKNEDHSNDKRIRQLRINNGDIIDFAHTSIPISPRNKHYGKAEVGKDIYYNCVHYKSGKKNNDIKYTNCKNNDYKDAKYGEISDKNTEEHVLRRLTFNPQFTDLTEQISQFIRRTSKIE